MKKIFIIIIVLFFISLLSHNLVALELPEQIQRNKNTKTDRGNS